MAHRASIEFEETEYRALLEMIQIADWVIHSYDVGETPEKQVFRDVRAKILSHVESMGVAELFEHDSVHNEYFETQEYDETGEFRAFIDEYDNQSFWEELIGRLSTRDISEVPNSNGSAMTPMQRIEKLEDIREGYSAEFETHGVARLRLTR